MVRQVEDSLRLKADTLLQALQLPAAPRMNGSNTPHFAVAATSPAPPLPAESAPPDDWRGQRGHDRLLVQLPARARSAPSVKAATKQQQRQLSAALMNPASSSSRAYLAQRFGVAEPAQPQSGCRRPCGPAPGMKKRQGAKRTAPLGVVAGDCRRDPHAEPPIRPSDVAAGLLSLTQRRLLPPHVDLTPAAAAISRKRSEPAPGVTHQHMHHCRPSRGSRRQSPSRPRGCIPLLSSLWLRPRSQRPSPLRPTRSSTFGPIQDRRLRRRVRSRALPPSSLSGMGLMQKGRRWGRQWSVSLAKRKTRRSQPAHQIKSRSRRDRIRQQKRVALTP